MRKAFRYLVNGSHIVHETFADQETAIINLKTGNYYSLNPTAAKIWERLIETGREPDIVRHLSEMYETNPEFLQNSVTSFIEQLRAEELIITETIETELENFSLPPSQISKEPFISPLLERYADLQELLLLDPIHEVGDAGFPHKKEN